MEPSDFPGIELENTPANRRPCLDASKPITRVSWGTFNEQSAEVVRPPLVAVAVGQTLGTGICL